MGVARLGDGLEEGLDLERGQLQPVERVDRVEVDRDGHELAVHAREHAVLVGPPRGEAREVVEDALRVRVEDVRPVAVDEQAVVVVVVVRVAGDVRALVDDEHALAELGREPFGEDGAGEAGADDEGSRTRSEGRRDGKMCGACDAPCRQPGHRGSPDAPALHDASGVDGESLFDEASPWPRPCGPTTSRRGRRRMPATRCARRRPSARAASQAATNSAGVLPRRDDLAVGLGDVADGRRDDGLLGGHVLERLGRRDELGRAVAREREEGRRPTRRGRPGGRRSPWSRDSGGSRPAAGSPGRS